MSIEIKTVGCRQNQYESVVLKNLIDKKLIFKDISNTILINSCSVTSRAMRDTRKIINQAKRVGKNIILTGCVIDKNLIEDPEIIYLSNSEKYKIVYTDANKYDPILSRPMISIETGCDKFCSYCIVPYLRGKPIIREFGKIIDEISFLADKGFFEFVLTGTNIAMAGNLIRKVLNWANESYSDIQFRLSSMDPDYLKSNIDIYKKPNVVRTAHISMQSLSNNVLIDMKRRHKFEDIYKITHTLLEFDPLFAIGGDLIIGFPSEGQYEFEETYSHLEELPLAYVHFFEYSNRNGTLASVMRNKYSNGEIKEHIHKVQNLVNKKKKEFKIKNIGHTLDAIAINNNRVLTTNYLDVFADKITPRKSKVKIHIEDIKEDKLYGKII